MSLKRWARVGGAVACLIGGLYAAGVHAAPWVAPGDVRARYAVQKLADRGHVNATVTTWPLMWGAVDPAFAGSTATIDARAVADSLAYLRFEREVQAAPGFRAEFGISAVTEPAFARGFDGAPRAEDMLGMDLQWLGETWAAGLSPAFALDPEDDESLWLDGSYLAGTAGNWVFGAGVVPRWWGPGWQSSLIFSSNARPIPAVWLNRKLERALETSWLSWVGPWQLTVFAGQLEEERAVPEAKLIGIRLTARPIQGLDVGLSRVIQLGGEGRPENGSTFWNAFIGRDNGQDGVADDPGNQLGSIDIRYGRPVGNQALGVYGQMMGEDEAGAFPSRKSWLLGADWTTQLASGDQQWFLEYTNTIADDFLGSAMPNITYDHHIYRSGYRYYGRSLGASFDGDASAITLGAFNFFADGRNLGMSLTYVDLNRDGDTRPVVPDQDIFYSVPSRNQKVAQATLSYGQPFLAGWLDLNARATDKEIELIGGEKDRWSLGAQWRYRF